MQVTLTTLSQHDGRLEEELIQDLLAAGLTHYYSFDELWKKWKSLSSREQEIDGLYIARCGGSSSLQCTK
jgi:hypothetical protein